MTSAEILQNDDRCHRAGFFARDGVERNNLTPLALLYQAIESGLTYEGTEDPGQYAGDTFMTIAAERGIETKEYDLIGLAEHCAALADLITFVIRPGESWEKAPGVDGWASGAFIDRAQHRLRRVVLVDRWSDVREVSESHSWRVFGECAVHNMSMAITVVVIGQMREGRFHSPWTKAWTHPQSKDLRMAKRDGSEFSDKWQKVWREKMVSWTREKWVDAMNEDMVIADVLFEVDVPVHDERARMMKLAHAKLTRIKETTEVPEPQPSSCDSLTPCQYRSACWKFQMPSVHNGFIIP